jgi:hypothetical protein
MNQQNNMNRAQLVLVAIAAASLLTACGTEEMESSVIDIHAEPGMLASAIEPGNSDAIELQATLQAPPTVNIEAFFTPTADVDNPNPDFVEPPHIEGLVPGALPDPEAENIEEEGQEPVQALPFENGCGTQTEWKSLGHSHCNAIGHEYVGSDYHGICEGGHTSTKFVCEKEQNETETSQVVYEGMTIGGAGTCKPLSALKTAAHIFCSTDAFQSGKALQPCEAGIDTDEDTYRVYLFTCRR